MTYFAITKQDNKVNSSTFNDATSWGTICASLKGSEVLELFHNANLTSDGFAEYVEDAYIKKQQDGNTSNQSTS